MKKRFVLGLTAVAVLSMALVAFAQPAGGGSQGGGGRGMGMRGGQAQMQALEAIEQAVGKLREAMSQMMGGQRGGFQDMSDEERAQFREQRMQRREQQQQLVTEIEEQIVMLKGGRQIQQEYEEEMASLNALQTQAQQENAAKTAEMIGKMISDRQAKHNALVEKLGYDPSRMGRRRQGGM
jgi:hypothetical protein